MPAPRVTIDELPEQAVATSTDLFVVQNGAVTKKMTVARVLDVGTTNLDAHINNPADAHDATAVSATPNLDPMLGNDVQTQLAQAATAISANTTGIANHIAVVTDAHDASAVSLAAVVGLAAQDVQAAVAELKVSTPPAAGTAGQVLTKATGTDFDYAWGDLTVGPEGPQGPAGEPGDWASAQTIETVSAATYAVVFADAGKLKRHTVACTVTLPSSELAVGQRIDFVCQGGIITFVLGAGATWDVNPTPSAVARSIGSFVTAIKMGTTTWALTGDLA